MTGAVGGRDLFDPLADRTASDPSAGISESVGGGSVAGDPDGWYDGPVSLTVDRMANGGAALGAGPDGRVVFVRGAIPGEMVEAEPVAVHRSRVEAVCRAVTASSADRVDPPCRHARTDWDVGCGGCDWQFIHPARQQALRVQIVADCLRRLARLDPGLDIASGPTLTADGYRTTVRAAVRDGRAAFRRRRSHDPVTIEECVVAHPLVEELLIEGRYGSASEVTVRVGANTGERMVVVDPAADEVRVPDGVTVVGRDELDAGRRPHIHEELGGVRLQISADSFFQCRPDGALAMTRLVGDLLAPYEGDLLDAYCGVGLFGALAGVGRRVIGVESNPSATADARRNLGPHGRVVESKVERWKPEPVGVVVADPARAGLKARACDRLVATGADAIALVSCDPASLARDAALLVERGYDLDRVRVLDLFGHTSHVESISLFLRR